jgi:putative tryptophan/tyrosine transport system substrate-binding protein
VIQLLRINSRLAHASWHSEGETAMIRRDIIAVVGVIAVIGAVTWPWGAGAQRTRMPVIGFLNSQSAGPAAAFVTAFRSGLREAGYREDHDVGVEYSWAEGDDQKLKTLMADLVKRRPDVIVATGGIRAAQAAQEATSTIPTLFISGSNPVQLGLVASINRPGHNLTGVSLDTTEMVPKRLETLRDLLPLGSKIAMLVSLDSDAGGLRSAVPDSETRVAENHGVRVLRIRNPVRFDEELDNELDIAVKNGARGLLVSAEPFFTVRRGLIVALAAKHKLAALYPLRAYVEAGGLASYGPDLVDVYHQIGIYAGRILKGAKPDALPVTFPRKWDLVLNLKTAKALGLEVPLQVRARANETID